MLEKNLSVCSSWQVDKSVITYPSCVFPVPGEPQNSIIFPIGTPSSESKALKDSQNVGMYLSLGPRCKSSKQEYICGILSIRVPGGRLFEGYAVYY